METTFDRLRMIEDFSNNLLSREERSDFFKRLKEDRELARLYRLDQSINRAIGDEKAAAFDAALGKASRNYERSRSIHIFYRVAASVVLLLAIGGSLFLYLNRPDNIEKISGRYYEPYQMISGTRSADMTPSTLMLSAYEAYSQKQYDKAILEFGKVLSRNPVNQQARFYLGICYIETGQTAMAEKCFTEVIQTKDVLFYRLSEYYLGMAYLKAGDIRQARAQFEIIATREGSYQRKASEILESLKAIQ